jgi:hypothetical protein
MYQCSETGLEGHKERRVVSFGCQRVRCFYYFRSEYRYQQNLMGSNIAVLELSTNDLRRIRAVAAIIQSEVSAIKPGVYRRIVIP